MDVPKEVVKSQPSIAKFLSKERVIAETWALVFLWKPSQHFQTDSCQKKLYIFSNTDEPRMSYITRLRQQEA